MSLISYIDTHSDTDFERFVKAISVPMGDHTARVAMNSELPDMEAALNGFVQGGNDPNNALRMIRLYKYFGHTWLMQEPVKIWAEADDKISQLDAIGHALQRQIQKGGLSKLEKSNFLHEIQSNDLAVTPLEKEFSTSLSKKANQLDRMSSTFLVVITLLLTSIGLIFSRRLAIQLVAATKAEKEESAKNLAILRNASDGIHILDHNGNIVEASDSFCLMLGYPREELIGMNVAQWDAFLTDPLELKTALVRQFETKERSQFETKHRRKDGTIFDVEVSGVRIDLEGRAVLFNSSRDISERKKFEFDLINQKQIYQLQQEFLNTVLESEPECVKVIAPNGNLIQMNPAGLAMLEVASEAEAQEIGLLNFVLPKYRKAFIELMSKILAGESGQLEFQIQGKQGTRRWLTTHAVPLRDSLGNITSLLGVTRDITERKDYEDELRTKNLLLNTIIENIPMRVFWKDKESRYIGCNSEFARDAGFSSPAELIGKSDFQMGWHDQAEIYRNDDNIVMRSNTSKLGYEELQATPNGQLIWLRTSKVPMRDATGQVVGIIGVYEDITERKNVEREIKISATAFESQEGMLITDADINILRVNHAFTEITGYQAHEVIGKNPRMFQSGNHNADFYKSMWKNVLDTGHWSGEIWNRRKNGDIYPEHLTITAVKNADGNVMNYVGSLIDISLRKKSEEEVRQLAYFDHLTGLPNRRLFRDRLEQDVRRVERNNSSLALLFIDLDRFKEVNDTLGHDKGDVLLIETARRIRQHVRGADTFARLGGDEFTIILPDYGDESSINRVVKDVLREIETPFDLGGGSVGHISCSIGIVFYPQDATNIEDLLKHADQAMYAAKDAGRNRFSYFTPQMQQIARERMALGNDLRQALSHGELEVHYQPIVKLSTGHIAKAEALLRWHHPQQGMVSPTKFIPLAEELGLIHELGNWVFIQSMSAVKDWRNRLKREIQVSVNRSPREFEDQAFMWVNMLEAAGLPGNAVTMEITEGLLLNESAMTQAQLLECRNFGIEVSIDDFGTGYSALSYLKLFDIDYLKIDRSFVLNLTRDESSKALVEAIIVMAHKLGIWTIAEGVETEAQRDLLQAFGCDFAQGYLYSKPVPLIEFEKLIAN